MINLHIVKLLVLSKHNSFASDCFASDSASNSSAGEQRKSKLRFLVMLGWLSKELYDFSRHDTNFDILHEWKDVCGMLMPQQIGDGSIHRNNDGTVNSRCKCFLADELGRYRKPGGSYIVHRCANKDHYYSDSLVSKWPAMVPENSHVLLPAYRKWTLQKLAQKARVQVQSFETYEKQIADHRANCAALADKPWFAHETLRLLHKARTLAEQKLMDGFTENASNKRKYANS